MQTRFLKTDAGIFKVVIKDDIYTDINTRVQSVIGKLISVGGKNTCVFINSPNEECVALLVNVKTRDGGCEINEKTISGPNTITMVNLAFTIVREVSPHIKTIKLEDRSAFTCYLDDGKSFGISLALYELAFHQSTWYERHFGATLLSESAQSIYIKAKEGFDKPKPESFNFNNKNLNELLTPIYLQTKTWREFFTEIYKIDKRCQIMFPWYKFAVSLAMNDILYEGQILQIDLYKKDKLNTVNYTEVKMGGSRKMKENLLEHDGNSNSYTTIENEEINDIPYTKGHLRRSKNKIY